MCEVTLTRLKMRMTMRLMHAAVAVVASFAFDLMTSSSDAYSSATTMMRYMMMAKTAMSTQLNCNHQTESPHQQSRMHDVTPTMKKTTVSEDALREILLQLGMYGSIICVTGFFFDFLHFISKSGRMCCNQQCIASEMLRHDVRQG